MNDTTASHHRPDLRALAERYRAFAVHQAADTSPTLRRWAETVADDPALLAPLASLPPGKQQPNLVFASARWHGARPGDADSLRDLFATRWPAFAATVRTRATQTNEPARCGAILLGLQRIEGPIALLEIGASAGLCLIPERYSYEFNGAARSEAVSGVGGPAGGAGPVTGGAGPTNGAEPVSRAARPVNGARPVNEPGPMSEAAKPLSGPAGPVSGAEPKSGAGPTSEAARSVTLDIRLGPGLAPPAAMPDIVWRAGLDLHPLDPADPDSLAWLRALVWPEHEARRARLTAAAALVAEEGVRVTAGDLMTADLARPAAGAPRDATLVVMHSATLAYLDEPARRAAVERIGRLGARRLSFEARGVDPAVPRVDVPLTPDTLFVAALDGVPYALGNGHGTVLTEP
ncbi:DUF2332 family protein [Streptomyces pseudogriseolus]|uniref:DUF2332 domain-containing protein n=1 Tax=Streptomyces gancidicus BKS 13-15 TaxID=1284664 RepID=M3DQV2_STREZ|nr:MULTISPECIES: DUF2332 family protein [Streptomyces]EMF23987.1 hypothetical protein H114_28641 [Streptomyces gancidicus BKS 13-15]